MGENGKMDYSYIVNISVVYQKYYNDIGRFPKSTLTSKKIKRFFIKSIKNQTFF